MKLLYLVCTQLFFISLSSASPRKSVSNESGKYAPYENLLRRLEENNYVMRSHLLENGGPTRNEVDDFDYFMDQKEVQRAWTRDKVKKHEDYMNIHFVKLATENVKMVLSTAQCKIPTRRCLDINKMEFGKTKSYWPNCALVHKCAHDSGCCTDPNHVCTPVRTQNIDLYFFSIEQNNEEHTGRVERLTFENHTLCDCRPMAQSLAILEPRDCDCPKHFAPVMSSLECRCDCDEEQSKPCKRVKKGKRTYHSKGCKGQCGPPACDYGEYKEDFKRCPRKNDKEKRRK